MLLRGEVGLLVILLLIINFKIIIQIFFRFSLGQNANGQNLLRKLDRGRIFFGRLDVGAFICLGINWISKQTESVQVYVCSGATILMRWDGVV